MLTPKGNYVIQSVAAERRTIDFTVALYKKLAELRHKYGITLDNSIHGELVVEFPKNATKEVIELVMKEIEAVKT